jgi:hypothetical protein
MRNTHVLVLSTLVIAFCAPRALEAQEKPQEKPSCDRTCLKDVMTKYLASLVAHDPKKAPLAANARFTEDAKELKVGEGFWKTATKLRPFRTDFLDPARGTAAVHAVIEEDGKPVLFAARLKVVDKKVTEIETIVVHNQAEGALFAPDSLAAPSPAMVTPPRKDLLIPRQQMIDVALRYPQGLKIGSFDKSDVPFAKEAYRLENGVKMAGPGCTFQPPSCENMRTQRLPTLAGIMSRVIAVDEENGTVLLWMDFGPGSLPGPPGSPSAGKALVTFEAFKVYGGEVHAVEAVFKGMPADTPSGWK